MNADQARQLLSHFKKPHRATEADGSWGNNLSSRFISETAEFSIYGGYVRSATEPEYIEIHIFWENIPGIDDRFPESYTFRTDGQDIHNWQHVAKALRDHLRDVIYSELWPETGVLGIPATAPQQLRAALKQHDLNIQTVAQKMGIPYRTLQNYLQDPWKSNFREMPLDQYRKFQQAVQELS